MDKSKQAPKVPLLRDVLRCCAWCNKSIQDGDDLVAVGVQKKKHADLTQFQGGLIMLEVPGLKKEIFAIVPGNQTQAAKEGGDLLVITCSADCAGKLQNALREPKKSSN